MFDFRNRRLGSKYNCFICFRCKKLFFINYFVLLALQPFQKSFKPLKSFVIFTTEWCLVWESLQYCLGKVAGIVDFKPFYKSFHEHDRFLAVDEARHICLRYVSIAATKSRLKMSSAFPTFCLSIFVSSRCFLLSFRTGFSKVFFCFSYNRLT